MIKAKATLMTRPESNFDVLVLEDGKIAFVFDPKKELGQSKSGKTMLVSTTSGAINVQAAGAPQVTISMNVYKK